MIVRVAQRARFVIVDQAAIEDERLSYAALGLLVYLLGRPDGWEVRSEDLARSVGRSGRDAVRAMLRELSECGYLHREKIRRDDGRWRTVSVVYERPPTHPTLGGFSEMSEPSGTRDESPGHGQDGFPGAGSPDAGQTDAGPPGAIANTEEQRKNTPPSDVPPDQPIPDKATRTLVAREMATHYYDWVVRETGARPAEKHQAIQGVVAHLLQDYGRGPISAALRALHRAVPRRPITRQTLLNEIQNPRGARPASPTRAAVNDWVDREAALIRQHDAAAAAGAQP